MQSSSNDNIISAIPRVHTEEHKSARTGSNYNQLVITFSNGYVYKSFLNDEQKKLIEYAIKESRQERDLSPEKGFLN